MKSCSLENPILDLNHKSNTSSEEEGSSTGDDERTSEELDLQSEVVKLTEELSDARNKIAQLQKDIDISNRKQMYSTEKISTIDLLIEEKKTLEGSLLELQQREVQCEFQYPDFEEKEKVKTAPLQMDQYKQKLDMTNELLSSIKHENKRLIEENESLRQMGRGNEPKKDQLQDANTNREILQKELAATKKSNYMLSKELKRIQEEQGAHELFQQTKQESSDSSERRIKGLQHDLQRTRVELIQLKYDQSRVILEKSHLQSQLKTARLRLQEKSGALVHKENRLLESNQDIENCREIITNLRTELSNFHKSIDEYQIFPNDASVNEDLKKLLVAKEDRLFKVSNELLESKVTLQLECGRGKLLENEVNLLEKELKECKKENSLLFKEMDVMKDDLRRSELKQMVTENKLTELETSSKHLQCDLHETKIAMATSEERYKSHILAREKIHSRSLERQKETDDIIIKQGRDIVDSNLQCEELRYRLHQVETAKSRIEKDLVACHQRIGDILRGDKIMDDSSGPTIHSKSEGVESLSMSLEMDMLKNSNRVLALKMEEATSSLLQTRDALVEEKKQHLEARAKLGVMQAKVEDFERNIDSMNSICQSYIDAADDRNKTISELRNNLFHTRKELEAEKSSKNKLSVSIQEERNNVIYSENENATLKSENNSLRSSKMEIINAYKSRVSELEVIAQQISEDLSIEKMAKKKLGQERLNLLRLIRDLKSTLNHENEKIEKHAILPAKADEIFVEEQNDRSGHKAEVRAELEKVKNELSNLQCTYMKETSSLKRDNEKLQKSIEEKNDTLESAHCIIESLNEELTVLHQSFNSFTSNSDQLEILSAEFIETNDELWNEQQKLLNDALSSHAAEKAANELLQEQYDRWLLYRNKTKFTSSDMMKGKNVVQSHLETEISRLKCDLAKEKGSREATESLLASFSENTTPQVEKKIRELRNELNVYKNGNAKLLEDLKSSKKNIESTQAENAISRNLISQLKMKLAKAEEFLGATVDISSSTEQAVKNDIAMKLELEGTRIERDKLKREVERLKLTDNSINGGINEGILKSQLMNVQENEQKLKKRLDEVCKKLEEKQAMLGESKREKIECMNQLSQCQDENVRLNKNMEKLDVEFRTALEKLSSAEKATGDVHEMKQQALLSIEELSAKLKHEKVAKDYLKMEIQKKESLLQKKDIQIKQLEEAREEHLKRNGIISRLLKDSQSKEKSLEEEIKRLQSVYR